MSMPKKSQSFFLIFFLFYFFLYNKSVLQGSSTIENTVCHLTCFNAELLLVAVICSFVKQMGSEWIWLSRAQCSYCGLRDSHILCYSTFIIYSTVLLLLWALFFYGKYYFNVEHSQTNGYTLDTSKSVSFNADKNLTWAGNTLNILRIDEKSGICTDWPKTMSQVLFMSVLGLSL